MDIELNEDNYANIRDYIGYLIGKRIVDITQHSLAEWKEDGRGYVMLMMEDGSWIKFYCDSNHCFDHVEG